MSEFPSLACVAGQHSLGCHAVVGFSKLISEANRA